MPSTTTSVRLPAELTQRLTQVAERTGRGKNAIITEALDEYLRRLDKESLAEQIRRASIAIAAKEDPEIDAWTEAALADLADTWKP